MTVGLARTNADLIDEEILGFLEFHTITDLRIHKDDLAKIFKENGITEKKLLPDKIHCHDAFRRATKEIQSAIKITYGANNEERKAKLLVREVKSDPNFIIRHLVREVINDKDERLDYNTVGRIILNRKTELIETDFEYYYLTEYPYDKTLETCKALYTEYAEFHNRETINNITRRIINSMNHVALMPNGKATFIPRSQRSKLDGLRGVIADLENYHMDWDKISISEMIPVIDTVEQRDMIARRIETDVQQSANELLADFNTLLESDHVGVKAVKGYAERFVGLEMKLEEYEGIVHQKMDVLHDQLAEAMTRIRLTQATLS